MRVDSDDLLGWLFIGVIVFFVVVLPILMCIDIRRQNEAIRIDTAACLAKGMEVTSIVQGSGKSQRTRSLCRAADGALYALD